MHRLAPLVAFAALSASLPAWGQNRPPDPKVASLVELQKLDQRVADIGWRLATRNLELCPKLYGATGLSLHTADQYDSSWRKSAIMAFSFEEVSPNALAVANGSPAWIAGIRPNDVILSINGSSLSEQTINQVSKLARKGSYAATDRAMQMLETAQPGTPISIEFKRADRLIKAEVLPDSACASRFEIATSNQLNANANGLVVQIYGRLAVELTSDDDLALVMAHELAHNALGHNLIIKQRRLSTGWSAAWTGSGKTLRQFERDADRYGIFMAARAGYRYEHAPKFWSQLSAKGGIGSWLAVTHPSPKNRARHAELAVIEVQTLQSAHRPLVPAGDLSGQASEAR